jgi:hypothetical protein
MGTECLNGNNKDIEIPVYTSRQRRITPKLQKKYIEDFHYNSLKTFQPLHYQTYYQKYENNIYKDSPIGNNNDFIIKRKKERPNSFKYANQGQKKRIHNFSRDELEDQVNDILRIRIPFFENGLLKTLSAFTFLSGNGPYHEGLIFFTTRKNFYIAQSYPITFIKVLDFNGGISEIISFNNFNRTSKQYVIPEIYSPQEPIPLSHILKIINELPNKYNLLNDNCQNFCNNILETLKKNFKIEMDNTTNTEKINFLKKQKGNEKTYYK